MVRLAGNGQNSRAMAKTRGQWSKLAGNGQNSRAMVKTRGEWSFLRGQWSKLAGNGQNSWALVKIRGQWSPGNGKWPWELAGNGQNSWAMVTRKWSLKWPWEMVNLLPPPGNGQTLFPLCSENAHGKWSTPPPPPPPVPGHGKWSAPPPLSRKWSREMVMGNGHVHWWSEGGGVIAGGTLRNKVAFCFEGETLRTKVALSFLKGKCSVTKWRFFCFLSL